MFIQDIGTHVHFEPIQQIGLGWRRWTCRMESKRCSGRFSQDWSMEATDWSLPPPWLNTCPQPTTKCKFCVQQHASLAFPPSTTQSSASHFINILRLYVIPASLGWSGNPQARTRSTLGCRWSSQPTRVRPIITKSLSLCFMNGREVSCTTVSESWRSMMDYGSSKWQRTLV